nr:hypothetical protein [Kiritimatiellia bacterium]
NGSVTLAAGTVLELAPGVKLGNLTPPSEGTATIKPAGEFAAGEYTLANKFSGSISNLTLDTSEMVMESRFIALLKTESETVDEEVVEKLILKVKEGGFILSIR